MFPVSCGVITHQFVQSVCTRKNNKALPNSIVMKFTKAQRHYMQLSYAQCYPKRIQTWAAVMTAIHLRPLYTVDLTAPYVTPTRTTAS